MFYRFARRLIIIIARIFYRFDVSGTENIPKKGSVIICSNHIHALDCLLLAMFCKRQIFFIGKKELFEGRFLGTLLRRLGAFPVDRGAADMKAYRHTIQLLKEDKALGIFSQGTRMQDFENAKSGVSVFALKTGAPIVPAGITGTYRPFSKVRLRFGPPITMESYQGRKVKSDVVEEVMQKVVNRVSELYK